MKRLPSILRTLPILILAGAGLLEASEESPFPYPSTRPQAAVEKRVGELLSALTLDEKISLLAGDGFDGMSTIPIPRLGIPKLVMADGPQGIRAHGPACSFPSGIALAATWDRDLAFRFGQALGREARARGIHMQLGPGVNIARTPLSGRNFEYYGEDPYLTGEMAASWIRGLQGQGVAATVKHFVGNDTEWRRMEIDSIINEQTLREIYLQPFRKALLEGGAWSVMSAYNKVNGQHSTENPALQIGVLKEEWGFPGTVMSDWWATRSVDALAKGLDLEMPMAYRITPGSVYKALVEGRISKGDIDAAIGRFLRMALSMGFLDRDQKRKDLPLDSPENSAVALDVATKSIVLLTNSPGMLPLDPSTIRKVVVYGPNAQDTPAVGGGSGEVTPFRRVSFLEGIRAALPASAEVHYIPMPLAPAFSLFHFLDFPQAGTIPPRIENISRMVCLDERNETRFTTTRESRIETSWSSKKPPEGVPKGREARIIWNAEIFIPNAGHYELQAEGHPEIRLGNRELGNPSSYVLQADSKDRIPLRVTANEVGRGKGRVSIRIVPVATSSIGSQPAKEADAAIVCVGLNPNVEGEGYDRGFALPVNQQRLIEKVAAANPKTIVVLSGGAAVGMTPWIGKVSAVLQTWYLGQSAGTALASVLFGTANPSGHLPCTFDREIEENPAFRHYPGNFPEGQQWPVTDYHEGIFYGYRGYDRAGKQPLFPFGHGLSYTTFELRNLSASPSGEGHDVSIEVSNTGSRRGATVVQLYISLPSEPIPRPLRELKGFERVDLSPGESKRLTISLPDSSLQYWDPGKHSWVLPQSDVVIQAGLSEQDIREQLTLRAPTVPSATQGR